MKWFTQLFSKNISEKKHVERVSAHNIYKPQVVMGWDDHPTLLLEDGTVFPREIEMIENGKYYPNGKIGEWLCDPIESISSGGFHGDRSGLQPWALCGGYLGLTAQADMCQAVGPEKSIFFARFIPRSEPASTSRMTHFPAPKA
jgi:hypothetical protein